MWNPIWPKKRGRVKRNEWDQTECGQGWLNSSLLGNWTSNFSTSVSFQGHRGCSECDCTAVVPVILSHPSLQPAAWCIISSDYHQAHTHTDKILAGTGQGPECQHPGPCKPPSACLCIKAHTHITHTVHIQYITMDTKKRLAASLVS